ncbi:hypothetical protein CTAYLR_007010 [Chrysophaeum taylorii]|uniref:Uncharacterized protein n=1 Tax=Chrysophaeum taylorii TaxID=2483200 RepID=A0AAD7U8X2_9STRA|nr:hypothetical protein CTAYLR_007010 [Chrysophaeum taylorii]
MPADDYKVTVVSETVLSLGLKPGKSWPLQTSETSLYLTEYRDDARGSENLLEDDAVPVATVIETPTVMHGGSKVIYMTGSKQFNINGTGFRAKDVTLVFDPPLERDADYILSTKSSTCLILTLKTGRKWRSDGNPGPLKLRRIDTGAGQLRIDAQYGGVLVAEVQVDLGPHGVTVESTPEQKVYQSQKKLSVQGHGFNTTLALNTLKWGNSLRGKGLNYTMTSASSSRLDLELEPGSKWRAQPTNLPGPLILLAVNAGAGLVPVGPTEAKKGRVVATVFEDPAITPNFGLTVYQTHTHELWLSGRGFTRGSANTELTFEPALTMGIDYVLMVWNRTHVLMSLLDGRKWSPTPGVLRVTSIDTGAGPFRDFTPVVVANVASDADFSATGLSVVRSTSQTLYQTAAVKQLTITGTELCPDARLEFSPPLGRDAYDVASAKPTELKLALKPGKKWRSEGGVLSVIAVECAERVELAYGQGIAVATILPDPTIVASERRIYATYTKKLVVTGSGFSLQGTELDVDPTPLTSYDVYSVETTEVTLSLKDGQSWIPDRPAAKKEDESLGSIVVTKIDTGAGEVLIDNVVVAKVYPDPEGAVCDDSCEWALDGVCDEETNQGMRSWFDDDFGGLYAYDDDYYGGFGYYYDDADDFLAPVCVPGTDCTDCGAAHKGPDDVEDQIECSNSCQWANDGYCDDTRTSGLCALGTDCHDCGPASAGNYTTWDDDGWWDDDAAYWDDDDLVENYFEYDDDAKPGPPLPKTVGVIKSTPNPKHPILEEQEGIGGIFMIVLEAIVVGIGATMCTIGSWFAYRYYKGEKLPFDFNPPREDDEEAWGRKKFVSGPAEITPDVTYSGGGGK